MVKSSENREIQVCGMGRLMHTSFTGFRCNTKRHNMFIHSATRRINAISRRTISDFKRVGVVGLGLMGHGVAQVTAAAGYEVLAIEAKEDALKTGIKRCTGICRTSCYTLLTEWFYIQNRRLVG